MVAARPAPPSAAGTNAGRISYDACPLCNAEDATERVIAGCATHPLYRPPLPIAMHWLACDACGHEFVDGYFDDASLAILFRDAQPGQQPRMLPSRRELVETRAISARIIDKVGKHRGRLPGRWLDVGLGNGALMTTAAEYGYEVVGLDARRAVVEMIRRLGFEAHTTDITHLEASPFDVISMADVLEHMPFPRDALSRAHRLLVDGGTLFLSMPDRDAPIWKQLDAIGDNPYWTELEHLHNFGRRRLYALLREHGFEPIAHGISERYVACMEVIARRL